MSGSSEFDNSARCIPQGMPAMMAMTYGMEIMQSRDEITMFGELNDQYRRIFLDGRKPSQKILNNPTYIGYSTGRWEGDTLVVDTVAIHEGAFIDGSSPHSDQMTVRERIRFSARDVIEDRITVSDPKALLEPWETVRTYRRAATGNDESCARRRAQRDWIGRNDVMATKGAGCAMAIACLATGPTVSGHHWFSQFSQEKTITVTGDIVKVDLTNPHSWLWVDVKDEKGAVVNWGFEGGSIRQMSNGGYTRDRLKIGTRVVIVANPAKDGSPHGSLRSTTFPDGEKLGRGFGEF